MFRIIIFAYSDKMVKIAYNDQFLPNLILTRFLKVIYVKMRRVQ